MEIGLIIGMATLTVGSVFIEDYLNKAGRTNEAQKVSMATSAGVSITAITMFIKLVKSLRSLG